MTKSNRGEAARDKLLAYRLAWGVRDRFASRQRPGNEDDNEVATIPILAPLIDFDWNGENFQLGSGLEIQQTPDIPWDNRTVQHYLSEEERELCRSTRHWLSVLQPAQDPVSAAARVNAFLLTLWIVRPTLSHVAIRFAKSPDGLEVTRVLERFIWIKDQAYVDVETAHLGVVRKLVGPLLSVYGNRKRLRNALALTFRGCTSRDWQSAFVCFSVAAETMLTYSRELDSSEALAATYKKLAKRYGTTSRSSVRKFKRLHELRAEIVHGRAYQLERSPQNLVDLTEVSNLLRELWRLVLEHADGLEALEADDDARKVFLGAL
jgi:hypothetical protein